MYNQPPPTSTGQYYPGGYPPANPYPPQYAHQPYPPQAAAYGSQPGTYPPQPGQPPANTQPPTTQPPATQPPSAVRPPGQPGGYPPQPTSAYPPQPGGYPPNPQTTAPMSGPPMWYDQYFNGLPPQLAQELQRWFASVDTDRSGNISSRELALVTFGGIPLGEENARKLIKIFDKDRSYSIDFREYTALHQYILAMQQQFMNADRDRSGFLSFQEVTLVCQQAGFSISPVAMNLLFQKYCRDARGLSFGQYLGMCGEMGGIRSKFEWADPRRTGMVTLNFSQYFEACLD